MIADVILEKKLISKKCFENFGNFLNNFLMIAIGRGYYLPEF